MASDYQHDMPSTVIRHSMLYGIGSTAKFISFREGGASVFISMKRNCGVYSTWGGREIPVSQIRALLFLSRSDGFLS